MNMFLQEVIFDVDKTRALAIDRVLAHKNTGSVVLNVLHQCTALKDDLLVLTGDMVRAKLLEWGCTTWEEFGVELKPATKRSSRLESIFCR